MVHFLHDSHPQAGDDEDESGANVSLVTRPEESAARPHMSLIPTHGHVRGNCHPHPDKTHPRKVRRASFEEIDM